MGLCLRAGFVDWTRYHTHNFLTGWPGPPRALLALTPAGVAPAAAAAAADGGGGGGGDVNGSAGSSRGVGHLIKVVAAVDAVPAWQSSPQTHSNTTPTAAAAAAVAVAAAAAETGNGLMALHAADALAVSGTSEVIRPSAGGPGSSSSSSSGVLGSLMNIASVGQPDDLTGLQLPSAIEGTRKGVHLGSAPLAPAAVSGLVLWAGVSVACRRVRARKSGIASGLGPTTVRADGQRPLTQRGPHR
jgi:hypothetical protein